MNHLRPLGPRNAQRSNSPAVPPLITNPDNGLQPQTSTPDPSAAGRPPLERSAPSLGLFKVGSASKRPIIKGMKLAIPALTAPNNQGKSKGEETPLFESYYGGPPPSTNLNTTSPEDLTIMPTLKATVKESTSAPMPKAVDPMEQLHKTMDSLHLSSSTSSMPDLLDDEKSIKQPSLQWSDDFFEEIGRLGEGAGGAVHKVRDKRTGKVMARKTITTHEAPMRQLLREISITSSTSHVNIILFHGAYMSPSSSEVKILMEYCEGGSLEGVGKRIKEANAILGEKVAGRLAEGILQGLAYLHSRKTIHRDIKPSNVLLSKEGVVKLCDFGVSGELISSEAGTFTGTKFYMAPERITGNPYTIRSDVWSTGISLLELVQNRFPFPNDVGVMELIMYISQGEPPSLEDEPGVHWSDEMKDFISQSLRVDPTRRPIPKDMLQHPWIVGVMKQEVNMARWIRTVWGWPKPSKRSKDSTTDPRRSTDSHNPESRPPSSQRTVSSSSVASSESHTSNGV